MDQEGPITNALPFKVTPIPRITQPSETIPDASSPPSIPFEEVLQDLSAGGSDSLPEIPIGGRLQHFHHIWESSSVETWILQTARDGLTLEFVSYPPNRFVQCALPYLLDKYRLMQLEISHLLEIQAIEQTGRDDSGEQEGTGFYSILFLVPKSSGGWHGVLKLRHLNLYISYRRFKMSSLWSILDCVRPGDLLQSIDLKEAYLHVPVHPGHRSYLRFTFANRHYQYRAMPFGLSSAPRTFTKVLGAVIAVLRAVSVRLMAYLDDILILLSSIDQAHRDSWLVIHTLQHHGFTLNVEKSHLIPTTSILHLGTVIDSIQGLVFLSPERRTSIHHLVTQVLSTRRMPLLMLSQLLGKMISCIEIVPWTR